MERAIPLCDPIIWRIKCFILQFIWITLPYRYDIALWRLNLNGHGLTGRNLPAPHVLAWPTVVPMSIDQSDAKSGCDWHSVLRAVRSGDNKKYYYHWGQRSMNNQISAQSLAEEMAGGQLSAPRLPVVLEWTARAILPVTINPDVEWVRKKAISVTLTTQNRCVERVIYEQNWSLSVKLLINLDYSLGKFGLGHCYLLHYRP